MMGYFTILLYSFNSMIGPRFNKNYLPEIQLFFPFDSYYYVKFSHFELLFFQFASL